MESPNSSDYSPDKIPDSHVGYQPVVDRFACLGNACCSMIYRYCLNPEPSFAYMASDIPPARQKPTSQMMTV